jgi:hypothetical protein
MFEDILKLESTQSNNIEAFQSELSHHIKQYDVIQGNQWKKITKHIIKQYQKNHEHTFQNGFSIRILTDPKLQTKYV